MSEHGTDGSGSSERILALWPGAAPPPGFADDVLDAAASEAASGSANAHPAAEMARRRRRLRGAIALGLVGLAAALLLVFALAGERGAPPLSGARVAERRETIRIGERAVLVAEPQAALAWRSERGATAVEQSRGSVFYRVDRAEESFSVTTPAGRMVVLGTCFRIDIAQEVATLTVYEGSVAAENEQGRVRVAAGERAVLVPGQPPSIRPVESADALLPPAAMPATTPATIDELRAREQAYASQVDSLRRRVAELESALAATSIEPGRPPDGKFSGFTRDELAWMARRCEVRYDIPGYAYQLDWMVGKAKAAELGLSDAERELINRINREGNARMLAATQDLLIELTGDRAVAEALEPRTLQHEIMLKSRPDDEERALQRLSAERAGLARPPTELSGLPPVERLLRLLVAAGDEYEERLAAAFGRARAVELRRARAGMASRVQAGCPDN
jgi:ferric-dicitrate binding protein FerR (iron transport regulator)